PHPRRVPARRNPRSPWISPRRKPAGPRPIRSSRFHLRPTAAGNFAPRSLSLAGAGSDAPDPRRARPYRVPAARISSSRDPWIHRPAGTASPSLDPLELKLHHLSAHDEAQVILPEPAVAWKAIHQEFESQPAPES